MSNNTTNLERILKEARFARKRDYHVYEYFKNRVYDLGLTYIETEKAVRELADILRV